MTVSDTYDDASYTFFVNVKKELPKFLSELKDKSIKLGDSFEYFLPQLIDPNTENSNGVSKTISVSNTFMIIKENSIILAPPLTKFDLIGDHEIKIVLSAI